MDAAAIGLDQAGDHVEHRGLAGAVGTEQADRLAAPHIKADPAHDLATAEAFLDAMRRKIVVLGLPAVAPTWRPRVALRASAAGRPSRWS